MFSTEFLKANVTLKFFLFYHGLFECAVSNLELFLTPCYKCGIWPFVAWWEHDSQSCQDEQLGCGHLNNFFSQTAFGTSYNEKNCCTNGFENFFFPGTNIHICHRKNNSQFCFLPPIYSKLTFLILSRCHLSPLL